MARMKVYAYKDMPENHELVRTAAEVLGISKGAFIRNVLASAARRELRRNSNLIDALRQPRNDDSYE